MRVILMVAVTVAMLSCSNGMAIELLWEDFSDGVIDDEGLIISGDAELGVRTGGAGGPAFVRQLAGASGNRVGGRLHEGL